MGSKGIINVFHFNFLANDISLNIEYWILEFLRDFKKHYSRGNFVTYLIFRP